METMNATIRKASDLKLGDIVLDKGYPARVHYLVPHEDSSLSVGFDHSENDSHILESVVYAQGSDEFSVVVDAHTVHVDDLVRIGAGRAVYAVTGFDNRGRALLRNAASQARRSERVHRLTVLEVAA